MLKKFISEFLNYNARPGRQNLDNNFRMFLEDPDPTNKFDALLKMYGGDKKKALEQLDLLEKHHYINNIDAIKVRQAAEESSFS